MTFADDDPALSVSVTLAVAPKELLKSLADKGRLDKEKARHDLARLIADDLAKQFEMTKKPWKLHESYFSRSVRRAES